MARSEPAFVIWGYGSENVFEGFTTFLEAQGLDVIRLPDPDKRNELLRIAARPFILLTTSHFTRDAVVLADFYPDIRIGCDFLEILHHCDPLLTVFYPHDLATPLVLNEPSLLSAFDLVLWPTEFFGYQPRPPRLESVGWIGFRGACVPPDQRRYGSALLFSDICTHERTLGIEGTYAKLSPILACGTAIKFPKWPGHEAWEAYFAQQGAEVIPAETPAGEVILNSRVVVSNSVSSITVEAAYMGTPVINLIEDYLPEGTQRTFLSGLPGCVQCRYEDFARHLASPPAAPKALVRPFDERQVLDLILAEAHARLTARGDRVLPTDSARSVEIEILTTPRAPGSRKPARMIPRTKASGVPSQGEQERNHSGAAASSKEVEPHEPDPHAQAVTLGLALRMLERNDIGAAFELLQEMINNGTTRWEPYFHIAGIARAQGEEAIALEFLGRACDFERPPGVAHRELAALHFAAGHFNEALACLSPLLRNDPQDYEALDMLRRTLGQSGELDPIPWARLLTDLRTREEDPHA